MYNKVMLIGNLGATPELKTTQSGTPYARLSLAINDSYTDRSQQKVEKTTWVSVVVFNRQAENCCKFLTKGSQIFVEGKLQQDSYPDPNTGKQVSKTYVFGTSIQFLSKGQVGQAGQQQSFQSQPQQQPRYQKQQPQSQPQHQSGFEDEVPF